MNDSIVGTLQSTLIKSKKLVASLNNHPRSYCCKEIGPYFSSVGSHIRHILDFYKCIFNGIPINSVDLTKRERNEKIENDCTCAINEIDIIVEKLAVFEHMNLNKQLTVTDDLGAGKMAINYTLGALLAQANAHTIHHYAIIGYILERLDVEVKDENFGYNPTTPKQAVSVQN